MNLQSFSYNLKKINRIKIGALEEEIQPVKSCVTSLCWAYDVTCYHRPTASSISFVTIFIWFYSGSTRNFRRSIRPFAHWVDTTWIDKSLPPLYPMQQKNRMNWMDPRTPSRCNTHVLDKNRTQAINYLISEC